MKKLILASKAGDIIHLAEKFFDKPFAQTKLCIIPTAANVYDEKPWLYEDIEGFKKAGFDIVEFDLLGKTQDETQKTLAEVDAVFVTGGNTYYLLEHVQKSGFDSVVKDRIANGLVYIGSSAGAILPCPTIDHARGMDDPKKANIDNYEGLGLVDFLILPHCGHEKYTQALQKIVDDWENSAYSMVGITDKQALIIQNDFIETIGVS